MRAPEHQQPQQLPSLPRQLQQPVMVFTRTWAGFTGTIYVVGTLMAWMVRADMAWSVGAGMLWMVGLGVIWLIEGVLNSEHQEWRLRYEQWRLSYEQWRLQYQQWHVQHQQQQQQAANDDSTAASPPTFDVRDADTSEERQLPLFPELLPDQPLSQLPPLPPPLTPPLRGQTHVSPWQPWKDFVGGTALAFSFGFLIPFASGLGLGRSMLSGTAVAAYFGCVLIRVAMSDD